MYVVLVSPERRMFRYLDFAAYVAHVRRRLERSGEGIEASNPGAARACRF